MESLEISKYVPLARIEFTVLREDPWVKGVKFHSSPVRVLNTNEIYDVVHGTLESNVNPGNYLAVLDMHVWPITRQQQPVYRVH